MKHYSKQAYQLGKPEVGLVVKVTAPDNSSTVVGVLHQIDKTLAVELPPGDYNYFSPNGVWSGSVALRVGPWRATVDAHSRVTVEVEEEALGGVVLVGELEEGLVVGELEA